MDDSVFLLRMVKKGKKRLRNAIIEMVEKIEKMAE